MSSRFVVTGTDTGVGKTVFSAGLVRMLGASFWKPIQAGLETETDTEAVWRLAELPADRRFPEAYRLKTPASPHIAASLDGVDIAADHLSPPTTKEPLVIEGAGGVMVPLNKSALFIDVFARWRFPVILVASTRLGTINHSLLSIEALRRLDVPIHGIAFVGGPVVEVESTIVRLGCVQRLGRLPWIERLSPASLVTTFSAAFQPEDFWP